MIKTRCKLAGEDGNIFNLLGKAKRALVKDGRRQEATDMVHRVMSCGSYDKAISIMMEYIEVY